MDLDFSQFYQSFFEESLEMLEGMEKALLELDLSGPLDSEKINCIFRAAHSIKGGSATFGFNIISEFTHTIESFLTQVRDGSRVLNQPEINLLLKSVDCLRQLIDDLKQQRASNTDTAKPLQATFAQLLATTDTCQPATEPVTNKEEKISRWDIYFQPNENIYLTGNDPLRLFQILAEWGTLQSEIDISRLPPFEQLKPEICYLNWHLQLNAPVIKNQIEEIFEWVNDDNNLKIISYQDAAHNTTAINNTSAAPQANQANTKNSPINNQLEHATLRVATHKIDTLINIIGELVIIRSALTQLCSDFQPDQIGHLHEILAQLELNCQELQQQALHIRMLPVSSVFNRFPRLVRDCAQMLGKQVELQLEGSQTEIDKSMLEKLVDPLQHLLRNAVDHGLELPKVRLAAGKSPSGLIIIKAYQQGGNIIIEVSDDGRGLSHEKIYAKALANHLITEQEALSESQLYDLIFRPGFSTAEVITEVSGRGVGMDIVMQNIHALGGSITVQSKASIGTTFILRLPLTLAIMDCQLTKVGEQTCIIPLNTIIEILKIETASLEELDNENYLYQLRGKYVPIINLKRVLTISSAKIKNMQDQFLVVVEVHNHLFGLLIDDLLTQQQVVIKSLEDNYQKIEGIAGATILGDGSVGLVLDVNHLIAQTQQLNMPYFMDKQSNPIEEDFSAKMEANLDNKLPEDTLQVLSFKLANHEYGIDILNVMEIRSWEQTTPLPKAPSHVTGIINLRGLIVPVVDLRKRFNISLTEADENTAIIVLKIAAPTRVRLVGFIVDAVSDTCSFTYGDIQPLPENNNQLLEHAVLGLVTVGKKMITLLHTHTLFI